MNKTNFKRVLLKISGESLMGVGSYGIDVSTALILSVMIRILILWFSVCVGFIALKFTGAFSFKQDY